MSCSREGPKSHRFAFQRANRREKEVASMWGCAGKLTLVESYAVLVARARKRP